MLDPMFAEKKKKGKILNLNFIDIHFHTFTSKNAEPNVAH
jgi:hypothetical protein